ncbi:hypothetical protein Hanom_Chr16g01459341 [Helianthus anomalus]
MLCFIMKMLYFMDFIEQRAEFPLVLDAPDNTSCHYFVKIQQLFDYQYIIFVNTTKCKLNTIPNRFELVYHVSIKTKKI